MRTRIVLVLALCLLVPLAAEAGKPKSPFYALVNADGTRAFGSGLQSLRVGLGVYWVYLEEDLRPDAFDCVAVGTSAGGFIGTVSIQPGVGVTILDVTTSLGSGIGSYDFPFYIVVHCPKPEKGA
jgi:hypothetical protein